MVSDGMQGSTNRLMRLYVTGIPKIDTAPPLLAPMMMMMTIYRLPLLWSR